MANIFIFVWSGSQKNNNNSIKYRNIILKMNVSGLFIIYERKSFFSILVTKANLKQNFELNITKMFYDSS